MAEYEWKVPASCLTKKDAERAFKMIHPNLELVRVITRELEQEDE